jgi:hypothetical protein
LKYTKTFVKSTTVVSAFLLLLIPAMLYTSGSFYRVGLWEQLLAFGQSIDGENDDDNNSNSSNIGELSSENNDNNKNSNLNCGDRDFSTYPNAQINELGEVGADYYLLYDDDGYTCFHNNDAEEIDDLELYRNQMPGPINGDQISETDLQITFGNCPVDCYSSDMDGLIVYLFPDNWSDKRILNSFTPDSNSGNNKFKVIEAECNESIQECTADLTLDSYNNGNAIKDGDYKLVINPVYDESELLYTNEATISTAV